MAPRRIRSRPDLDPKSELPLSAVVLHILLALADGERHGYGIAQAIDAATHGEIRTGPGTLYGSIQRMLTSELIEDAPRTRQTSDEDERRRYYRMTAFGERVLQLELDRLADLVAAARAKHLLRDPEPA